MRHITIALLVAFLFPAFLFSQEENNDAVYIRLEKEFTLNADGSMDYNYHKELKLQTYRAFHNLYGETFVVYNPAWQSVKINDAHTIMADGKKVSSPSNAFNEVLPAFCANAPVFNGLREMVITHTGLERNATVHLDYTIHTKKDFYPALMGNEVMAENEPVRELTVKVRIPKHVKLNYKLLCLDAKPVVTEDGNYRVYSWSVKNVPAIAPEDFQPGSYELYPRLVFSTATDREEIYRGFMKQAAFAFTMNDEMKKAVADLSRENKTGIENVLKLQEKVVNEFRLWPVPLKYTGYACRPATETWNSNGGTLAEKAVLLIALLKASGVEAFPVLVVRNSLYDEETGTLSDIDDIFVKALPAESDPVFLSLSALNNQTLDHCLPGKTMVVLRNGEKPLAGKAEEIRSQVSLKAELSVTDNMQLSGTAGITLTNACDPWLMMLRDKSKTKSIFGGGLSSADLKESTVITSGPVEGYAKYTIQKDKPFHKDSNYFFLTLPLATGGTESWGIHLLPQKRISAVELPVLLDESYEISIILSKGLSLFAPSTKKKISNSVGSFIFQVKKDGDKLIVIKEIHFLKRIIDPSDYGDFKVLMDNWNSDKTREVVLIRE